MSECKKDVEYIGYEATKLIEEHVEKIELRFRGLLRSIEKLFMEEGVDAYKINEIKHLLSGINGIWNLLKAVNNYYLKSLKQHCRGEIIALLEKGQKECEYVQETLKYAIVQRESIKIKNKAYQKEKRRRKQIALSKKKRYSKQYNDFKKFHLEQCVDCEYMTFSIQQKINRFYRFYPKYKENNKQLNPNSVVKRIGRWIKEIEDEGD
jgi:hypothetical protein